MLDLKLLRESPDCVTQALRDRKLSLDIAPLLRLEKERRALLTQLEQLKHEKNVESEHIAQLKKDQQSADSLIAEMKALSQKIEEIDKQRKTAIMVVEHNIKTLLGIAGRAYVLDKGKVVYEGNGNALRKSGFLEKVFLGR